MAPARIVHRFQPLRRPWQFTIFVLLGVASLILLSRTRSPCFSGGATMSLTRATDGAAVDALLDRWALDSGCANHAGSNVREIVRNDARRSFRADNAALLVYPLALIVGCLLATRLFKERKKDRARRVARAVAVAVVAGALLDVIENRLALDALAGAPRGLNSAWLVTAGKFVLSGAGVLIVLAGGWVWAVANGDRIRQLIDRIGAIVQGVKPIVRRCSVSLVLGLLVAVGLALPNAVLEILRALAEDEGFVPVWSYFGTTLGLAFMAWYWARAMLTLLEPNAILTDPPAEYAQERWYRIAGRHLPRVCGTIPLLGAAWGMYRASATTADNAAHQNLIIGMWVFLLMAVVFYAFVTARRRLFRLDDPQRVTQERRWRDLGQTTRIILHGTLVLWGVVFVLVWATSGMALRWLGAASIISMAVATWIPIATLLRYWRARTRFPFLTALLLVSFVFSYCNVNDNRVVRHWRVPRPATTRDVDAAFKRWLDTRTDRAQYRNGYPVFFVAAEGGGLRAGYHVAMVLSALQDRCPAFAQHVFGISSVSGGSVGAAVFAGLTRRQPISAESADSVGCLVDQPRPGAFETAAHATLETDFLSPVVAALLYTDFAQNLLPGPVAEFDRARALERGFERAWHTATGDTIFASPFEELWSDSTRSVPYLFLNTTSVGNGDRLTISPLSKGTDSLRFLVDNDPTLRLPLSTAVALTARFPYVTPEGVIPIAHSPATTDRADPSMVPRAPDRPRFADGGYFENSGGATLLDVLTALRFDTAARWTPDSIRVRPIVLRIGFTARGNDATTGEPFTAATQLNELLSPVRTLFNTRDARGRMAVRQLRSYTEMIPRTPGASFPGALMIDFPLREREVPLVTSWLLSDAARNEIRSHVREPSRCHGVPTPVPAENPIKIECSLLEALTVIDTTLQADSLRLSRRDRP